MDAVILLKNQMDIVCQELRGEVIGEGLPGLAWLGDIEICNCCARCDTWTHGS